ncbi:MAG TPA: (d)CMP kinase [Candidatus Omnitrophota bacterium]|nr:(d)CMP kinase [Candidatus Omnitrophota bacterium]
MRLFNRKINAVAIDGPAGSGKSTVARLVAAKLGYRHIDTGAMYRALTLKMMKLGVDLSREEDIVAAMDGVNIDIFPSAGKDGGLTVTLDGEDVSAAIRAMDVTANVKHVCKIPAVREKLVAMQRKMAVSSGGSVMEGRDIGTVVLRDARYKFYLDAAFEKRVERRFMELKAKGDNVTRECVAEDLRQRDHTDKTRKVGPLKMADDAVLVDTTDLGVDEVVEIISKAVRRGLK